MSTHLQVVSGASNVVFTAPNKFTYTLPDPYQTGDNNEVSLKDLRLYYSWFNMTAAKTNTSYSYVWVDSVSYPVVMPDGIYSYTDFQGYLERTMFANGHYLIDSTGAPVYFIHLQSNPVYYRITLTVDPVPAALPSGYTAPSGWVAPGADVTPQLVIPETNLRNYLGFAAGTFPAATQAVKYQVNGTAVPQVTSVSSLMLQSTMVKNEYGPDSRTLISFNLEPGTAPGSLVSVVPYYQDWIPMQQAIKLRTIDLTLVDQLSRPVAIEDPAGFICTLTLRK